MGSADVEEYKVGQPTSVELQMVVAIVKYRLAPEHPHPTQINDCLDGLKWVSTRQSACFIPVVRLLIRAASDSSL